MEHFILFLDIIAGPKSKQTFQIKSRVRLKFKFLEKIQNFEYITCKYAAEVACPVGRAKAT